MNLIGVRVFWSLTKAFRFILLSPRGQWLGGVGEGERKEELPASLPEIFLSSLLPQKMIWLLSVLHTFICHMSHYLNTFIQFLGGLDRTHTSASRYSGSWGQISQILTGVSPLPPAHAPPFSRHRHNPAGCLYKFTQAPCLSHLALTVSSHFSDRKPTSPPYPPPTPTLFWLKSKQPQLFN